MAKSINSRQRTSVPYRSHNVSHKEHNKRKVNSHSLFTHVKSDLGYFKEIQKVVKQLNIDNMNAEGYIPSKIDQPELVSVKTVNLLQKFGGRGLFASQDVPAGTILGIYTGEEYSSKKAFEAFLKEHEGSDNSYAMTVGARIVDAKEKGNFTRYINFSDSQANVEFRESTQDNKKVVLVVAIKDIKAGKQLLVDYNCYDQRASTDYFFLSPEDGWQSAEEVYQTHAKLYSLLTLNVSLPLFDLKTNDFIYVTEVGEIIAEDRQLSSIRKKITQDQINLPILKTSRNLKVMDFSAFDSFTTLMFATYLGQFKNVQWLVKHGANIDQQQNHSGNGALFFALEGYRTNTEKQDAYLDIILFLISSRANLCVHDRDDRTFLHKTSMVLSTADFKVVISHLKSQNDINFKELFTYVDKDDYDPLLFCLANKDFEKASILLENNTEYFQENYTYKRDKSLDIFNKKSLISIVEGYNIKEEMELIELLEKIGIKSNSKLSKELGLEFASEYNSALMF